MDSTEALIIGLLAGLGLGALAVWLLVQYKPLAQQQPTEEAAIQYQYNEKGQLTAIIRVPMPK